MTDPTQGPGAQSGPPTDGPGDGPVVRDKRRIDPETGRLRTPEGATPAGGAEPDATAAEEVLPVTEPMVPETDLVKAQDRAAEHLADLQRLQAEYVNYRRRVERDREAARDLAIAAVLESLLPVLDDVHLARQHGDLGEGPFAAISEKLETTLGRYGLQRFGEPGETFDPTIHEALIRTEADLPEGTTETTVVQILQPGYRAGDRVVRAARVAVADPS